VTTGDIVLEIDGRQIRSARTLFTSLTVRSDRLCRITLAMIAVDPVKSSVNIIQQQQQQQQQNNGNGRVHQAQDLFAKVKLTSRDEVTLAPLELYISILIS
jgi:hypothetical protein